MNSQFKKGIVELCVLGIIKNKNMYGLEVIETISKYIDVNENTIYPILRRLTREEYFNTYKENSSGAPRKYYQINEKGLNYYYGMLKEWKDFLGNVNQILLEEE